MLSLFRARFRVMVLFVLGLAAVVCGSTARLAAAEPPAAQALERTLSPAEMREDLETLTATFIAVHPNLYFKVPEPEVLRRKTLLQDALAAPLTVRRFDELVAAFVAGLGDDHTVAYPLPGMLPEEATAQQPAFWRFERIAPDIGYLDLHIMRNRPGWQKLLETAFRELGTDRVPALIVDLRNNVGGDSTLGDDLLSYLSDQAYRSITRKSWRFSSRMLAQMATADPWGLEQGDPNSEPPPEFIRLFAQNPTPEFKEVLRKRASPKVREILTRHAPHWLGLTESAVPPTETLSLDLPLSTPVPPPGPRYTGRVCFLISPKTFSSGVILANTVEDFHLAPLIGEETKPCNQFGEPYHFRLPRSKIYVEVATAQYVRANGDAKDPHGVIPTIPISASDAVGDYAVLNAAIAWAKQRP